MAKANLSDTLLISLYHLHNAGCTPVIELNKLLEFRKVVSDNLDKKVPNHHSPYFYENDCLVDYVNSRVDKDNNITYSLKEDVDYRRFKQEIGTMSLDIAIASCEQNALDVLGLEIINGQMSKTEKDKVKRK